MTFSPGGNTAPSYPKDKAEIWKEFRKLWKRVNTPQIVNPIEYEVVWSFSGVLNDTSSGVQSPRWPAPTDIRITSVTTTLSAGEGQNLTVVVDADDVDIATVADTPAGSSNQHNMAIAVPYGTLLAVRWTVAGALVANVSVVVRYVKVR